MKMTIRKFYEFEFVNTIKNEALRLIGESNKIYNIMEGLHILSYFPKSEYPAELFLNNLNLFFSQEYPTRERFNLIRHLRLLPDLCQYASQITEGGDKEHWQSKRDEILYLILGTQNMNGSWGYYPQSFSPSNIENSLLKEKWMILPQNTQNELNSKCIKMREYYTVTQGITIEKSENSNVWTAYSLATLMSAGLTDNSAIDKGIDFLKKEQDKSGGWGFNKGGVPNISATCIVLTTLFKANKTNESNFINDKALKRGVTFVIKKISALNKSAKLLDIDKGGGADLKDNSEFTFSITANAIDCFSIGIIDCPELFVNDKQLTAKVLNILNEQIDILLSKNLHQVKIWEHRIILESLRKLYELYLKEVSLEEIKNLSGKLVKFLLMGFEKEKVKIEELKEFGWGIKISKKYPLSYFVIFLFFLLDWATRFDYFKTKMNLFFVGVVLFVVIMFVVSIKDIE
jgi:hypothetical protein